MDQHVKDFMPPKPVVMGGGKSPESRAMGEIVTSELVTEEVGHG